jgi:hypothetical protein
MRQCWHRFERLRLHVDTQSHLVRVVDDTK